MEDSIIKRLIIILLFIPVSILATILLPYDIVYWIIKGRRSKNVLDCFYEFLV